MVNDAFRRMSQERNTFSILETLDVHTGQRTVLREFDDVIEAPNWTSDGRHLIYNSLGRLHKYELASGAITPIDTGFAVNCNNDHVLSADQTRIAVSHHPEEDGKSRIYTLPIEGGAPTQHWRYDFTPPLALADFMQEFGRISSDSEGRKGDDVDYPCRAVCLDTYQGEATLTFELGPEGERPFGATPRQVAATTAQKKRLGQVLFGQGTEDGLLVHTGLMSALNVEVKQARAERRSEVAKQKAGPRPLRMFISYAHQDESVRVELDKHLKPLAQDGLIESWSYRQIEPGSDWRKEVQRHLGEADLVVPLLSVDFINSDFAFGVELRSALDQRQRMRVIPILVRPFAMNDELKDIQMLPTDNGVLRPLSEWGDRRESGLTEVACGIKRVIEKMRRADGG